jgi:hypothetical protein
MFRFRFAHLNAGLSARGEVFFGLLHFSNFWHVRHPRKAGNKILYSNLQSGIETSNAMMKKPDRTNA